jgi:ribosomal protein S27AE
MERRKQDPVTEIVNIIRAVRECPGCGRDVISANRHCDRCGHTNPGFNRAHLEKDSGKTLEELIQTRCAANHLVVRREMERDENYARIIKERPFCENCGERIVQS